MEKIDILRHQADMATKLLDEATDPHVRIMLKDYAAWCECTASSGDLKCANDTAAKPN